MEVALNKNSFIIKAPDLDECIRVSNIIAPEHLQIMTKNPRDLLKRIITEKGNYTKMNSLKDDFSMCEVGG